MSGFDEPALRRGSVEPGKETDHRGPVTNMGAACPGEFRRILTRLGQQHGVAAFDDCCAGGLQPAGDRICRRGWIEQ